MVPAGEVGEAPRPPMSPADLRSVAQEAALAAMARNGGGSPAVTHEDFLVGLGRVQKPAGESVLA